MDNLGINLVASMDQEDLMHNEASYGLREILKKIDNRPDTGHYVTLRQAARICGIRAKNLMVMMECGQLDYINIGNKSFIAKVNLPKMGINK